MSECEYYGKLGAYHDGELDAAGRAAVERHLTQCPTCVTELAILAAVSRAFHGVARQELSVLALRRLHQRMDLLPSLAIGRMAAALTAVAASILLACGVWLWRSSSVTAPAGPMPVWEAAAVQRAADPAAIGVASEDQLAGWMVQDLSRESGHD